MSCHWSLSRLLSEQGSRLEPQEKIGLASSDWDRVADRWDDEAIWAIELDEFLEGKAATIETGISEESAGTASMSCLKEDFPAVLRGL